MKPDFPTAGVSLDGVVNTPDGLAPLDWIKAGDLIETWDAGFQPIARIDAVGGLGGSVLAGQRMLAAGWPIEIYFGYDEMLALAGDTLDEPFDCEGRFVQIVMQMAALIRFGDVWVESHSGGPPIYPVLHSRDVALVKRTFGCPLVRSQEISVIKPADVSTTFGSHAAVA